MIVVTSVWACPTFLICFIFFFQATIAYARTNHRFAPYWACWKAEWGGSSQFWPVYTNKSTIAACKTAGQSKRQDFPADLNHESVLLCSTEIFTCTWKNGTSRLTADDDVIGPSHAVTDLRTFCCACVSKNSFGACGCILCEKCFYSSFLYLSCAVRNQWNCFISITWLYSLLKFAAILREMLRS